MAPNTSTNKILVVCMGNICRSPTMEAVIKAKAKTQGLALMVDSAGTINYHEGSAPDKRSAKAGQKRGYSFAGITSRQIVKRDFEEFDLILCADKNNLSDLKAICPSVYQHKLHLFLTYAGMSVTEVPDPYYGDGDGFELVLDLVEAASDKIIKTLL
ncbi:low molecular weight protein-tyrosine-phosphatase [Pseudoalteromonas luteoviolacea]|uniref:low molecular weight protein-tyrosine-phosphatase n=1 Tax=Pseudoalteromonas luteoviolacea TaxID=43657 RepID=UPI001153613B|nr:low molecular weight protein-tyrosine-phosphatase [Pseudoalteromonas luteoviolacea]TQF71174.1 low molecular weight phosphotyrosine protein phosphatase [Pseudoalteromonas luteoviolacea]